VLFSLPVKGFLGTGATFEADINLAVQLLMAGALVVGIVLARRKTLPSARRLPDKRDALELVDDWTRDVALVPATS
jgi:hypothetical protein